MGREEEKRWLAQQEKADEAVAKVRRAASAVTTAQDAVDKAKAEMEKRAETSIEAHKALIGAASVTDKKEKQEAFKAADKEYNEAKAEYEKAAKALQTAQEKHDKIVATVNTQAAKLKKLREVNGEKKATETKLDVERARKLPKRPK